MMIAMTLMGVCIVFMGVLISDISAENKRLRDALTIRVGENLDGKSAQVIYLESRKEVA